MESLRKWLYKPKRDDRSLLAQFFFADEALNMVAAELDSFDGRENPERCSTLVNQLRHCQERVLNITGQIMDQLLGNERVPRGFRVKFPEDVLHENLAGQLWFGAECLAAGSSIMHREGESEAMRPLARALTHSLDKVRSLLRDHCLRCNRYGAPSPQNCTENLHESLKIFDRLFADFELCYVSAMVPVKTPQEFEMQQLICVLFSETLQRARRIGLLTQDQVDDYDPALMFAIPRLAIVSGLLIFSNGPLGIDKSPELMSDMFRPFRSLLHKIRELLWTLDRRELYVLEKLLCTNEDIANIKLNDVTTDGLMPPNMDGGYPDISEFFTRFYSDYSHCEDMLNQIGCEWTNFIQESTQSRENDDENITDADYLPENIEILSPLLDGMKRLSENIMTTSDDDVSFHPHDSKYATTEENSILHLSTPLRDNTFHISSENNFKTSQECINVDEETKAKDENEKDNISFLCSKNKTSERRNSNKSVESRKSSRSESISGSHIDNNLMITRNLSSNGLSMFDPLSNNNVETINDVDESVVQTDKNALSDVQSNVNGDDRCSSLSLNVNSGNVETNKNLTPIDPSLSNLLHNQLSGQIFSFSTNDVSNLAPADTDPEFDNLANNVTYSPSRCDKTMSQSSVPSTSHGYLILNAISQEPVLLTSLSNSNSVIYEDSTLNSITNPLLMTQTSVNLRNVENEFFEESISVASANLSCLLLTNEDFSNNFMTQTSSQNPTTANNKKQYSTSSLHARSEDSNTHSSERQSSSSENTLKQKNNCEKSRFIVDYESDSADQTYADSGICTENTSLDRSPDSESRDIDDKNNDKLSPAHSKLLIKSCSGSVENSALSKPESRISSMCNNSIGLNYCMDSLYSDRNEAGPSHKYADQPEDNTENTAKTSDISNKNCSVFSECTGETSLSCDKNLCSCDNSFNNPKNSSENIENINLTNSYDNNTSCDNIVIDSLNISCESDRTLTSSNKNDVENMVEQNQIHSNPVVVINEVSSASQESHCVEQSCSSNSTGVLNQRKIRKSSPKNKKKTPKPHLTPSESKAWSPAKVILQNRPHVDQKTPMKLNLDHIVDDGTGESCSSQSSATSSFHSDWADDEEIALALQAHELASRHKTRAKFRSSEDLIHRLFVCIAGVADQLQTNFASDLRNILKSVFLMNQTPEIEETDDTTETLKNENNVSPSETTQESDQPQLPSTTPISNNTIEFEVSASEVLRNGDSFDSIHSAEEAYADHTSSSQRSHCSSRSSNSSVDESIQNDINERRNSQSEQLVSEDNSNIISRHNTISSITKCKMSSQNSLEDNKMTENTSNLSNHSSSSSLDSNHSENQNTNSHVNNNLESENNLYVANDENFVNERMEFRSPQDLYNEFCRVRELRNQVSVHIERAPEWVPDIAAPDCMRCGVHFTAFRRRHHCRNCGKVFCASCSANSIPLPRFGQHKPVRVCEECFRLLALKSCIRNMSSTNGRQPNYTHR